MNTLTEASESEKTRNFEALVREYTDYVYHIAYRLLGSAEDARDAVQETFVKAFRNYHRLDLKRGPRNWLCTIALNTSRDLYRARKRRGERVPLHEEALPVRENAEKGLENRLEAERVLLLLPMEFRAVMLLFYMEEKSLKEISELLGIPLVLVKVRLFRARKMILKATVGREHG